MRAAVFLLVVLAAADLPYVATSYTTVSGVGRYQINDTRLAWKDAWKACQAEGSNLAVIDNDQEASVIRGLMNEKSLVSVGFHSLFADSHWTTISGVPLHLVYSVWGYNRPDNYGDIEFCGGLNSQGELEDIPCMGYNYHFVCEKSLA